MKKAIGQRVGHRIRVRRAELEMSQGELAATLGKSQGHVSHWEKGNRSMALKDLERIAQILQCSPAYLLGEEQEAA